MSGPPGTTSTPKLAFSVDPSKAPHEQAVPLHNRWHPEIPVASTQKTGQIFRVECIEWTGGQVCMSCRIMEESFRYTQSLSGCSRRFANSQTIALHTISDQLYDENCKTLKSANRSSIYGYPRGMIMCCCCMCRLRMMILQKI